MMKAYLVIFLFSIVFSLEMIRSGFTTSEGLVLYGVNQSDGIWNLALIAELMHHFPPEHPGFAGLPLRGYHFLYHMLLAFFTLATGISHTVLYFQVFPLLIAFGWGAGVYHVVYALEKNKAAALLSTFFSYFGGSFAFLLPLVGHSELSIDSGLGISQPLSSSLPNPAFASSVVLAIWALFSLIQYSRTNNKKWAALLCILTGVSVGFKVYAGMILMGGLLVASIVRVVVDRRWDLLSWFGVAFLISSFVFFPFNGNYGFLTWAPFWPLYRLVEGPLNFTVWDELWQQHILYSDHIGIFLLSCLIFTIFFFGNIGTRIVAALYMWKSRAEFFKPYFIFYYALCLISFGIPFMFLQPTGGGFNIIQMNWYFLFFLSLFTGPAILCLFGNKLPRFFAYAIVCIIGLTTLPTSVDFIVKHIESDGSTIPANRLEMVSFLAGYGEYDETVIEVPYLSGYDSQQLDNWFWHDSSVIIAALGKKRLYVAHEVVPYPYDERIARYPLYTTIGKVIACRKREEACGGHVEVMVKELREHDIALLYVHKPTLLPESNTLKILKENETATLYEVLSM